MIKIDFKNKGTALPKLTPNIKYSVTNWKKNEFTILDNFHKKLVSYGVSTRHDIVCILAEHKDYAGSTFYEFPLEIIEKLALKQGLESENTIYGYKVPSDINVLGWKKHDIARIYSLTTNKDYHVIDKSGVLPKEVVELWEPVYDAPIQTFVIGTENIVVTVSKEGIIADGVAVSATDLKALEKSVINNVRRVANTPYSVTLIDAKYKIGCSIFTLEEIKKINEAYNNL